MVILCSLSYSIDLILNVGHSLSSYPLGYTVYEYNMNSDGHLLYLQNTGYCAMGRSLMIYHETIRKVSQSNAIMKGTLLKFFFFAFKSPHTTITWTCSSKDLTLYYGKGSRVWKWMYQIRVNFGPRPFRGANTYTHLIWKYHLRYK